MTADFADDPNRGCAPGKVNPDDFFADRHTPGIKRARAACRGCPFRDPCLNRALDHGERNGIWSGVLLSSKPERDRAVAARRDRQITDLWRQGIADGAIALHLGVHPGAISKIRGRLGLPAHYGPGGRPVQRQEAA
jgi:hypothetical protein